MTDAPQRDREQPAETEAENPTSDELDVEGPNESAPGHEPAGSDRGDEQTGDPPAGQRPSTRDGE
jgi:hypothetical protein